MHSVDDVKSPDSGAFDGFCCRCCGNCCRGDGYVRVTSKDVEEMARELGLDRESFLEKYTRPPEMSVHARRGDYWLINHPHAPLDCIFLVDNKCVLHSAKPEQCRGFPRQWNHRDMLEECAGYQEMIRNQSRSENTKEGKKS